MTLMTMLLCVKLPVEIVELWERKIFTVILIVENVKMVCRAAWNMFQAYKNLRPAQGANFRSLCRRKS